MKVKELRLAYEEKEASSLKEKTKGEEAEDDGEGELMSSNASSFFASEYFLLCMRHLVADLSDEKVGKLHSN